jgi:phosphoglycolate phosphatase-like HAD superfamily hydrolase
MKRVAPDALVLFDIDGTLISGDGSGRRAFERACLEVLGIEGALVELRLDGMTDPLILDHVAERRLGRAIADEEAARVYAAYVGYLEGELARSRYVIHDGVEEALGWFERGGATIGLATGNLRDGARVKLERGGLWHRFAFGGFGSDARERAELVRIGIRRGEERARRRFAREEILVVGDTPKDIAAAHAAGATAIAVATGSYDEETLRAAGADQVWPTLAAWVTYLAGFSL